MRFEEFKASLAPGPLLPTIESIHNLMTVYGNPSPEAQEMFEHHLRQIAIFTASQPGPLMREDTRLVLMRAFPTWNGSLDHLILILSVTTGKELT